MRYFWVILAAPFVLLISASVWAEPDVDAPTIHFEFTGDSQHNTNSKLNGSYFFADNDELYVDLETAKVKDSISETKSSNTIEVDVTTDSTQKFSGGGGIKWFGLKDALTETTLRAPLRYKPTKKWKIELVPATGTVRLYAVTLKGKTLDININDTSGELALTFSPTKMWDIKISTEDHSYDRDVKQLSSSLAARLISHNAITLAQALLIYENIAEVTFHAKSFDLGLSYTSTKSAFDDSIANTGAATVEYFFDDQWSANAELARTKTDAIDPSTGDPYPVISAVTFGLTYNFE